MCLVRRHQCLGGRVLSGDGAELLSHGIQVDLGSVFGELLEYACVVVFTLQLLLRAAQRPLRQLNGGIMLLARALGMLRVLRLVGAGDDLALEACDFLLDLIQLVQWRNI